MNNHILFTQHYIKLKRNFFVNDSIKDKYIITQLCFQHEKITRSNLLPTPCIKY